MGTLFLILMFQSLAAPSSNTGVIFESEGMNPFEGIYRATGIIESGLNPFAYNPTDQKGGSYGVVQIGQSMLNAFNAENGTHYILNDCFDVSVSRKVFMWHFQKQYPNTEASCRSWNGGNNWQQKKQTKKYYLKIQKAL